MTCEVPVRARQIASRLAALFASDSGIAVRLNDAQHRLREANYQLWSGLHPDALGLVYEDAHRVAVGQGESAIAVRVIDALRAGGGEREAEITLLAALAQTHWTIHRAFLDYQAACEERRQLAVDVGELSVQLIEVLAAAGWPEEAARRANVHDLAIVGHDEDGRGCVVLACF
jgi:hypothetical protein